MLRVMRTHHTPRWSIIMAVACGLALLTASQSIWAQAPAQYEGGDAPSSHNRQGLVMTTYDPLAGGVQANFPVIWDYNGTVGPGPGGGAYAPGYYGFCHSDGGTSSLGSAPTWERDADKPPDEDGTTNIDPTTNTADQDGSDDGVTVPSALPHCVATTVHVVGVNNSGGTLYVNAWFDWNRDGDWEDSSLCECTVDEWAIQDQAILSSGSFTLDVPVTPCHPGGDQTEPLWARVTLSEVQLGTLGAPWTYGAQPHNATVGCFSDGETEDYFLEPTNSECDWSKEVSVNGEYAGQWDEGPFGVNAGDTVDIHDELSCNFDYGWDLMESWDPAYLSLAPGGLSVSHGTATPATGQVEWTGSTSFYTLVAMDKTLQVDETPGPAGTVISETVDFTPAGRVDPMTRQVELVPPECAWAKQVWINDEGPYEPGAEPLTVALSDTVTIEDEMWCNFNYDWDLSETWDPSLLSLAAGGVTVSHGSAITGTGQVDWTGSTGTGTCVSMTKTLQVDEIAGWDLTVITETLDFGPPGAVEPLTKTVQLRPAECAWDKDVWVNLGLPEERGPFEPGGEPVGVLPGDMVTIQDQVSCNFDYGWDLLESWAPSVLSLSGEPDVSHGVAVTSTGQIDWSGSVSAGVSVSMTKTLEVDGPVSPQTLISETTTFSPEGKVSPMAKPLTLMSYTAPRYYVYVPLVMKSF